MHEIQLKESLKITTYFHHGQNMMRYILRLCVYIYVFVLAWGRVKTVVHVVHPVTIKTMQVTVYCDSWTEQCCKYIYVYLIISYIYIQYLWVKRQNVVTTLLFYIQLLLFSLKNLGCGLKPVMVLFIIH